MLQVTRGCQCQDPHPPTPALAPAPPRYPPTPGSQAPPMGGCWLGRVPGQAMGWGVIKDPQWSTVWVWSSLPRDCLGGVCLALRSRKLLNPAPVKGHLLKRLSPPSEGRRGGAGRWTLGSPVLAPHLLRPSPQLPPRSASSERSLPAPFYFLSLCPKACGRVRPAQLTPRQWVRCPVWLHPQGP